MRSMTGFGRGVINTPYGLLSLELQSVNRRHLETSVSLPKELSSFEVLVKKSLAKALFRGQVQARFSFVQNLEGSAATLTYLQSLKKLWEGYAEKLKFSKEQITLSFLMHQLEISNPTTIDQKKMQKPIIELLTLALDSLLEMKNQEGSSLLRDIEARIKNGKKIISKIEKLSPQALKQMEKKLKEKMLAFSELVDADDRFLREIVLYSEKLDITEEITRLYSHLDQFSEVIHTKEEAIGKKMDFIIQEMMRESNTIASKTSDAGISKLVIEMKAELEKIREQTQNIE